MIPVIEHLWISGIDAKGVVGIQLCVLDSLPFEFPMAVHLPLMRDGKIRRVQLKVSSDLIEAWLPKDVVIISGDGHGRGALTAAWFLHTKQQFSMDESYEIIRTYDPHVRDNLRERIV